ncbi:hypothetical protein BT93_A1476 [Corymbia citriodora subsp. variegata]|nr:hypothetical protein BT93_A1476 [Corymbia citriodora subsp. variegata]
MAKLYHKKGKVHPSPPPPSVAADQLALLPAAILTLAAALSPEDREVLAYLISCSNSGGGGGASSGARPSGRRDGGEQPVFSGEEEDHPPRFQCGCFRCYKSFWSRWDASPNHQAIHEIIDAYEEGLLRNNGKKSSGARKKKQRKGQNRVADCGEDGVPAERAAKDELGGKEIEGSGGGDEAEAAAGGSVEDGEVGSERGTVRKIASFIGERIWGVWNRI